MKKRGGVKGLFRLAEVLIRGDGDQRDEYNSRQMEKGACAMMLVIVVLGAMILVPAALGFAVYDSDTMAQAEAIVKAEEEARKTPEYLEYEAFQEQWQQPEEYVMVYQIPLEAQYTGNQAGASYDRAGALYIRTGDKDMTILFHPEEDGVKVLQSNYRDYTEENIMRSEHVFAGGAWYRQEDWMQKQHEPGFAVSNVENYHFTGGHISFPVVKGLGSITETTEDGRRRLTFHFSEAHLDDTEQWEKSIGFYSGEYLSRQQSLLIDSDGSVIEQQQRSVQMKEETVNLIVHKEEVTDWQISRYLTRNAAEANALFQKFVEQGPEITEDILDIYEQMKLE